MLTPFLSEISRLSFLTMHRTITSATVRRPVVVARPVIVARLPSAHQARSYSDEIKKREKSREDYQVKQHEQKLLDDLAKVIPHSLPSPALLFDLHSLL